MALSRRNESLSSVLQLVKTIQDNNSNPEYFPDESTRDLEELASFLRDIDNPEASGQAMRAFLKFSNSENLGLAIQALDILSRPNQPNIIQRYLRDIRLSPTLYDDFSRFVQDRFLTAPDDRHEAYLTQRFVLIHTLVRLASQTQNVSAIIAVQNLPPEAFRPFPLHMDNILRVVAGLGNPHASALLAPTSVARNFELETGNPERASNNPERTLPHPENLERGSRGHGSGSTEIRNEVEHPVDAILRGAERGFVHGAEDITRRR